MSAAHGTFTIWSASAQLFQKESYSTDNIRNQPVVMDTQRLEIELSSLLNDMTFAAG